MKKILSTETLFIGDDPVWVTCRGHVDIKLFNKAYKQEWSGDGYTQKDLKYEYWKKTKLGYTRSAPGKPGAVPLTIVYWDGHGLGQCKKRKPQLTEVP